MRVCKVCNVVQADDHFRYWGHKWRVCHGCRKRLDNEKYRTAHPARVELERTCKVCSVTKPKQEFFYAKDWRSTCRDCLKQASARRASAWNRAHPERFKELCRRYASSEKGKATARTWEKRHPGRSTEYLKVYREAHREDARRYTTAYRKRPDYPEKFARWFERWVKKNPDKWRIRSTARTLACMTVKLGACSACGSRTNIQRHHVDYENAPTKVLTLCGPCHLKLGHDGCWRNQPKSFVRQAG